MKALLQILMDPSILGWSCLDPDPGFAIKKKDKFHITSLFQILLHLLAVLKSYKS